MAFDNFKGKTFTVVTASIVTAHKDLYRKTPSVLRQGAKEKTNGGFFNYDLILSASDKNLSASFYADDAVLIEQDTGSKEVAVYLTASIFRDNMNDFLQNTAGFNSQSYQQISASFFSQIGNAVSNIPSSEAYVAVLAAPFESGSIGSGSQIIPLATASIKMTEHPGLALDYTTGNVRKRKVTIINSSNHYTNSHFFLNLLYSDDLTGIKYPYINFGGLEQTSASQALSSSGKSHLTRSFQTHFANSQVGTHITDASELFYYVQSKPVPKFSFEVSSSNNTSSFFALTASFSGAADFGVVSGSPLGHMDESLRSQIGANYYNGSSSADGQFVYKIIKGVVEGEGEFSYGEDSFSGESEKDNTLITPYYMATWNPNMHPIGVRSGSFYFTPYPDLPFEQVTGEVLRDTITGSIAINKESGSGQLITLYWVNHTYTSSFTGSFGNFTRHQLKNQTGDAAHHQLPFLAPGKYALNQEEITKRYGIGSHLWKDGNLSIPADIGWYIHSSSFTSQSKANMANQLGSENHTSSFYTIGVFDNPFNIFTGGAYPTSQSYGYTSSQHNDPEQSGLSYYDASRRPKAIFLKKYDNTVTVSRTTQSLDPIINVPFS